MSPGTRGLLLGLALAGIVACSAGKHASAPAPASAAGIQGMSERPDQLRAQITRLDADLGSRLQASGQAAASPDEVAAARPMAMDAAAKVCTPPPSPSTACADVCTLASAICDDAARICDLAAQLPGDPWAADKCAGGKASCERSRQRCCDCH